MSLISLRNYINIQNKEIKILSSVDVSKEQANIDKLCKEYRTLDSKIQSVNWQTDLIESK